MVWSTRTVCGVQWGGSVGGSSHRSLLRCLYVYNIFLILMAQKETYATHGPIDNKGSLHMASAEFQRVCSVPELRWYWKIKSIRFLSRNELLFLSTLSLRIVHDVEQLHFFTSLAFLLEALFWCLKHVFMIALSESSNGILNDLIAFSLHRYSPSSSIQPKRRFQKYLWSIERFLVIYIP